LGYPHKSSYSLNNHNLIKNLNLREDQSMDDINSIYHLAKRCVDESVPRMKLADGAMLHDYTWIIRNFIKDTGMTQLKDLDTQEIKQWIYANKNNKGVLLKPASQRQRYKALNKMFRYCVELNLLEENPLRNVPTVELPQVSPRPFTKAEASALMSAARRIDIEDQTRFPNERHVLGRPYELAMSLMLQEGLRTIEVCRLHTWDINFESRVFIVKGKGNEERTLPITDQTFEILTDHMEKIGHEEGALYLKAFTYEQIKPSTFGARFRKVFYASGVKKRPKDGKTAHAARHTAGTDVYRETKDIRAVQEMLGHKHVQTTLTYVAKPSGEALKEAMNGRKY